MNRNIFLILIFAVLFASCDDVFDPAQDNIRGKSTTYSEPNFGLNLLTQAYVRIPTNNWSFNDVATDDAVSNDPANNYLKMATGQWTASNNAMDFWTNGYSGIQYTNLFIPEVTKMKFTDDPNINKMFQDRLKGEAFGLRAILYYYLLQAHAGWANGKLLGVPIFLTELTTSSNYNVPRADFNTCVKQIYQDVDSAAAKLPLDYVDIANANLIPTKYFNMGITDYATYNRVFGAKFIGLVSGRILKALRAQVALLAASPAFNTGNANGSNGKWSDAAAYAAEVINLKGGLAGMPSSFANGVTWYNNASEITSLANGANSQESLWRYAMTASSDNSLEAQNFPPSLFGNGRMNPTQNLVDAFPMANGYPISKSAGTTNPYDPANPYANRDPRLKAFIYVNGLSVKGTNLNFITGSSNSDAVGTLPTSTRTGYYMRKLLREDFTYNSITKGGALHYKPRIRYTEIYLTYAEAANEAWGPLSDPNNYGYTAYDVIKAIRKRALNITTDPYLESIKSDKDAMRQLIRNERRLELCFEGFRFWDLRRWNVSLPELAAPALGITISGTTANPIYGTPTTVENRAYQNYMYFGPIPYGEILKWSNLQQNDGWK